METIIIRKAIDRDLETLAYIYNYEVEHGVATLDIHQQSIESRRIWMNAHNIDNHPLIVAELDGKIAGYASLSEYRNKEAYRDCTELSVYINPGDRHKGIAKQLISWLLEWAAKRDDIHCIVSVITSGNEASIKLHKQFGFTFCGTLKEVGMKFGRYLDIDNYQLLI